MRHRHRTVRRLQQSTLLALMLTACSAATIRPMPDAPQKSPASPGGRGADKPAGIPLSTAAALAKAVESSNALGFELYQRALQQQAGNVAMSSVSIASALAMTFGGAKGETAAEIGAVLRSPADAGSLHAGFEQLGVTLDDSGKDYTLKSANRLYLANEVELKPAFSQATKKHYGASVEQLDFRNAPEAARKTINGWVEEKTQQRIKDLLPGGSITAATGLVLTNAIYFKGQWAFPFGEASTQAAMFKTSSGELSVDFMKKVASYAYAEVESVKAVRLPYKGGTLAMTIVMPDEGMTVQQVESALSHRRFVTWQAALVSKRLDLRMPKFKIEADAAVNLSGALQQLGMKRAFTDKAEFGGISTTPLGITDVFHKAFVEVDEKGTEAAAATAVVMAIRSMVIEKDPIELRLDRPFLFFIHDTKTNAILFQGRVAKPTAASAPG